MGFKISSLLWNSGGLATLQHVIRHPHHHWHMSTISNTVEPMHTTRQRLSQTAADLTAFWMHLRTTQTSSVIMTEYKMTLVTSTILHWMWFLTNKLQINTNTNIDANASEYGGMTENRGSTLRYRCRVKSGGAELTVGRASVRLMLRDWTTHGSHLEPSTNSSLLNTPSWFYNTTQHNQHNYKNDHNNTNLITFREL